MCQNDNFKLIIDHMWNQLNMAAWVFFYKKKIKKKDKFIVIPGWNHAVKIFFSISKEK